MSIGAVTRRGALKTTLAAVALILFGWWRPRPVAGRVVRKTIPLTGRKYDRASIDKAVKNAQARIRERTLLLSDSYDGVGHLTRVVGLCTELSHENGVLMTTFQLLDTPAAAKVAALVDSWQAELYATVTVDFDTRDFNDRRTIMTKLSLTEIVGMYVVNPPQIEARVITS